MGLYYISSFYSKVGMNKIELIGRILFFGLLAFSEIGLAIVKHIIAKIAAAIKSPL